MIALDRTRLIGSLRVFCSVCPAVCVAGAARKGSAVESYITMLPGAQATGEFVDRKSRFIAHLVHVETPEQAAAHQADLRSAHFDARHHVPAWILADGSERASDDGEPQRTSGMPTLEVLRGAGLRDVCCVTVRYFGGTLLGPGGLVRAYTAVAQQALEEARAAQQLVEMTSVIPVDIRIDYARFEQVSRMVADAGGRVSATDFTDEVCLHAVFRAGEQDAFCARLRELMAGRERIQAAPARFAEFC